MLETRIRMQKAVLANNCLPQPSNASTYFSHPSISEDLRDTLAEVEALSEELFSLRKDLLRKTEGVELSKDLGKSRKRRRGVEGEEVEYLKESTKDLSAMEAA